MGDSVNTEQQLLEVEALQSIYNEEEFITFNDNKTGLIHVQFYAFITLPKNFLVVFNDGANTVRDVENAAVDSGNSNHKNDRNVLEVKHLPPIELFAILPKDYPVKTAPQFTLSCSWLSTESVSKLCKKLDNLWNENELSEILYIWTIFLKEETLMFLELENILPINKHSLKHDDVEQRLQNKKSKGRLQDVEVKCENDSGVEVIDNTVDGVSDDGEGVINKSSSNAVDNNNEISAAKLSVSSSIKCENGDDDFFNDREIDCSRVNSKNCLEANTLNITQSEVIECHFHDESDNCVVDLNKKDNINRTDNKNRGYTNRYFYSNGGSTGDSDRSHSHRKHNGYYKRHNNYHENGYRSRYNYNKNSSNHVHKDANHSSQDNDNDSTCKDDYISNRKSGDFKKSYNRGRYNKRFNCRDGNYTRRNDNNRESSRREEVFDKDSDVNRGEDLKAASSGCDSVSSLQEKFVSDLTLSSDSNYDNNPSSSSYSLQCSSVDLPDGDSACQKLFSSDVVNDENNSSSCVIINNKDRRVKKCISQYYVKHLLDYLESYNQDRILTEFRKTFFCCSICYQDKLGIHCTQFKPCDHTFCKDCVSQYVQIKIKEGTVYVIKCPEDKCSSDIMPSQVRDLVGPEQFALYDNILLTTTLETMSDVITCPRRACQYPASRDPDEKMAVCPACQYVFCAYCKMGYHGVEPCRFRTDEKAALVKEYLEADHDVKLAMEQRYGKKQLNSLVHASLSESWIFNNSQNCPHCNASIEKSGGCNKMVCWRCSTFFCWLCQTRLDPNAPYKHYYDPKSKCRNQLFEHDVSDDDDEDNILIFDDEEEFED